MTEDDRGYVDDFDNYVQDLSTFVRIVVEQRGTNGKPLFLLAHSMGGAIATLYLEANKKPPFAAAALVTPMMQPWVASEPGASLFLKAAQTYCDAPLFTPSGELFGASEKYADGGDFDEMAKSAADDEKGNGITQDHVRYLRNWGSRAAECEAEAAQHCGNKTARVGGATYRWLNQACEASARARGARAADITVPVLLLQGGRDKIVNPARQVEFCQAMNKGKRAACTGLLMPQSLHATLIEADEVRSPALAAVLSHFDCAASGGKDCRRLAK